MGKSLAEYAALHPGAQEPPISEAEAIAEAARYEAQRASDQQRAEELKESVAALLEQGAEPETALYAAVQCIGLLSCDQKWADNCRAILDGIYSGLEQESLLADRAATVQKRLRQQTDRYNDRLLRQWRQQLKDYEKISMEINKGIAILTGFDPDEQPTDE